ncbi:MAG: SufD family Fe-S cluster assembly protein [Pseudomonadota bacterium]|nr:SufD family Fe-S cluster assembly protein [Pseudomonadota bacterium]
MRDTLEVLANFYEQVRPLTGEILSDFRARSYAMFLQKGLPSRKSENWRYAITANWFKENLKQPEIITEKDLRAVIAEKFPAALDSDIIIYNGQVLLNRQNKNITVSSLRDAISSNPKQVEMALQDMQQNNVTSNPFVDLNLASFTDGFFIDIPENKNNLPKISITYVNTDSFFLNLLNIVNVGSRAGIHLVENYIGEDSAAYNLNSVSVIRLACSASLAAEQLLKDSNLALCQNFRHVSMAKESSFTQRNYKFAGGTSREETVIDLQEEHATCNYEGIDFSTSKNWHATHVKVLHNADNCTSKQNFRSLVANTSQCSFLGHIYVPKGVKNTVAYQDSKSLLLGETARSNVKPYLEIFTDDVVCTHSATVGELDKKSLFYLRSRGLTEPQAYILLLNSFVNEIIMASNCERIKAESLECVHNLSKAIFLEGDL